jgi:hypothetical protein
MKRKALRGYRSQLRAFGPDAEKTLFDMERYWKIGAAASARPA